MKIGYSVEGGTDRAVLEGLRRRWCPQAELVPAKFRGTTGLSAWREIKNICLELSSKGIDFIILLRDSNTEAWREVLKADLNRVQPEHRHLVVAGVCYRNIECWLCADADWMAKKTGRSAADFRVDDPKGTFESALAITGLDKKEKEIAEITIEAPLRNWLANPSFEAFYDALWNKSKEFGCAIENLRDSQVS